MASAAGVDTVLDAALNIDINDAKHFDYSAVWCHSVWRQFLINVSSLSTFHRFTAHWLTRSQRRADFVHVHDSEQTYRGRKYHKTTTQVCRPTSPLPTA